MKKIVLIFSFLLIFHTFSFSQHLYQDTVLFKDKNILKTSVIDNKIWFLAKEGMELKLFEGEVSYQSINLLNTNGFSISSEIKFIAAGPNNNCYLSDGKKVYEYANNSITEILLYNAQPSMNIKFMVGKGNAIYLCDETEIYTITNNKVVLLNYLAGRFSVGERKIIQLDAGNSLFTITLKYQGRLFFYTLNTSLTMIYDFDILPDTVNSTVFSTFYPDKYICFSSSDTLYYRRPDWLTSFSKKKTKVNHLIGGFEYIIAAAGDSILTIYDRYLINSYSYKLNTYINEMESESESGNVLWLSTTNGLHRFVDAYTSKQKRIPFCLNSSVTLSGCDSKINYYRWQKNGVNIPGANTCQINVSDTGEYKMISRSYYQWVHKDTTKTYYYEKKVVDKDLYIQDYNEFCEGGKTRLYVNSPSTGNTYKWYLNGEELEGEAESYHWATKHGSYSCLVTNCNGYQSFTNSRFITVHPTPNSNIFTTDPNPFCGKDSLHVKCISHLSYYTWSFKPTGSSVFQDLKSGRGVNPSISIYKEGYLKLSLYDDYSCSSVSSAMYCKPIPNPFVMIVKENDNLIAQPYFEKNGIRLFQSNPNSYEWHFNNQIIPNAIDSVYTPTIEGLYTVKIVDKNGCDNTSPAFSFYSTGVEDIDVTKDISIYPTICSTKINMTVRGSFRFLNARIYSLGGIFIKEENYSNIMQCSLPISTSELNNGLYILKITTEKSLQNFKFLKVK